MKVNIRFSLEISFWVRTDDTVLYVNAGGCAYRLHLYSQLTNAMMVSWEPGVVVVQHAKRTKMFGEGKLVLTRYSTCVDLP